ncbi:MAG: NADH:ubiquinone reductase (Na(+)-transporting) subunit A, partial [Bacteroidetes bacterium HGW-Bacteroidetes-22]
MSKVYKIKKGLDIKLAGEAERTLTEFSATHVALKPTDFIGVFPKLLVQEGDVVKAGDPVFCDKAHPEVLFTSPVHGKVAEIVRGPKRILLEIKIELLTPETYTDFGKANPSNLTREEIISKMLQSGVWPMIRQRPYSVIANPADKPKAIFISGFDTAPLAPDYDFIVHGQGDVFQTGIDALKKLTNDKIYLNLPDGMVNSKVLTNTRGVEINHFSGPHPAGNVGTQIALLCPINKGDVIWYLRPQEVIIIGKLFAEGRYNARRIIAVCGSEVRKPKYYKVPGGVGIKKLLAGNVNESDVRFISGNVLTGTRLEPDGYLGFYDSQITVIPEGDYHEFLGWSMPRLHKHSFSRSYFSWLTPDKHYVADTNLNGGVRALVMTGQFEQVFPFDIYPTQLLKSIIYNDIDEMEKLGIYEVDEEDFALCEYID